MKMWHSYYKRKELEVAPTYRLWITLHEHVSFLGTVDRELLVTYPSCSHHWYRTDNPTASRAHGIYGSGPKVICREYIPLFLFMKSPFF